jgi:hypothetical protein
MQLTHTKFTTIALPTGAIAIAPAQTSLYRSTSGKTELRIAEGNATRVDRPGSYTTRIGNQTWNGSLKVKADGGPTTGDVDFLGSP